MGAPLGPLWLRLQGAPLPLLAGKPGGIPAISGPRWAGPRVGEAPPPRPHSMEAGEESAAPPLTRCRSGREPCVGGRTAAAAGLSPAAAGGPPEKSGAPSPVRQQRGIGTGRSAAESSAAAGLSSAAAGGPPGRSGALAPQQHQRKTGAGRRAAGSAAGQSPGTAVSVSGAGRRSRERHRPAGPVAPGTGRPS
ncbi:unnamed protein product [Staurois parvus]|uniref:Uncharacterized protein n=1 Tax=Staurois parvus TaxID=386267 RepID=A0ABN9D8R4_9NEOB|nr:unnamed protein product [Staurois parvus]